MLVLCAGPMVAPVAAEMLKRVDDACLQFRRLIEHWPQFGPAVANMLAAAIQETASAVMRQCSMIVTPSETRGALIVQIRFAVADFCPGRASELLAAQRNVTQWQRSRSLLRMRRQQPSAAGTQRPQLSLSSASEPSSGRHSSQQQTPQSRSHVLPRPQLLSPGAGPASFAAQQVHCNLE